MPPLFYKIVVSTAPGSDIPDVPAFLFPHHRAGHGEIEDYLVSVDVIEALIGLNFFSELEDDIEDGFEDRDTFLINVYKICKIAHHAAGTEIVGQLYLTLGPHFHASEMCFLADILLFAAGLS